MRDLDLVADFYEMLAYTAFQFLARTRRPAGLDSAFFDSLAGTVASMKALLLKGHIGDAYTLLRRFREVGWLQAYVMLRLEDNSVFDQLLLEGGQALDQEGFVRLVERAMQKGIYVEEIEKWMSGEESLPELRKFHEHIVRSPLVEQLNFLFDNGYEEIHNRCNDHVHLNFFRLLRANIAGAELNEKMEQLDQFTADFRDLFIRHLAYTVSIKPMYMTSSDYMDALECGLTPEPGSQHWVAPIVQEVFDAIVANRRPDVKDFIRENSYMDLA